MASYSATRALTGTQPIARPEGVIGIFSKFALTAALGSGDTVALGTVPAYAVMLDVILATDELDTGASAAITYSVGDSTSPARFISGAAQGNTVPLAPTHMNVAGGMGYQQTANEPLVLTVTHAPSTGAASGNVYFTALYSFEAVTASSDGTELP